MSGPAEARDAAPLTADLLARKGMGRPAGLRPAESIPIRRTGFTPRAITGGAPAPCATRAHARDNAPATGDRARVTLRLDATRHLRLKLAAAHLQQSLQDVLTDALDGHLDRVVPGLLGESCACFAGRPGDDPAGD